MNILLDYLTFKRRHNTPKHLSLIQVIFSLFVLFSQDIKRHDQGVYRCRIDFRTSQTQSYTYNLSVISEYTDNSYIACVWVCRLCATHKLSLYDVLRFFISVLGKTKFPSTWARRAAKKGKKSITLCLYCLHSMSLTSTRARPHFDLCIRCRAITSTMNVRNTSFWHSFKIILRCISQHAHKNARSFSSYDYLESRAKEGSSEW